jgi:alkylation response protein AidB-like acyl-CoA dehydrogenase
MIMTDYKINLKDILFILNDQLDYGSLCTLPRYKDLNDKTLDLAVNEAARFAKKVIDPLQEIGETKGVIFKDGQVSCADEFKDAYRQYAAAGWISAARNPEFGGQGFPHMMRIVVNDLMYGACQSFNMAPSLTHGAAHLIETFATDDLKKKFIPRCYNGDWTGTMCLTEADAGSNLANIRTTAFRKGDDFIIKGTKTFISWGDHNLTENIIHLVLARVDGAPDGVKGISLFIVPKKRVNDDGILGPDNDVRCVNIEKKLGLHASPTCTLEFGSEDNCIGYLCGQKNMGLAHMFQMMNSARINTGVSGMSIASTAYLNALAYTKSRIQGKDIADNSKADVPIINHPDIRRMLMWMKASVDGMRSMIYTGAYWTDLAYELEDGDEKNHYKLLINFITPIIKAFCSDTGFRVCETAIQCLGGYGYCRDFPLEQYLRDVKILSLYEGTNGIQSIDLMGRKMTMAGGTPFRAFTQEIETFCKKNRSHPTLGKSIKRLESVFNAVFRTVLEMNKIRITDPVHWGANTYPALLCFGELIVAWRLLDMAIIADKKAGKAPKNNFYTGKILQATWYTDDTLPQTLARITSCQQTGHEIAEMPEGAF